MTDVAPELAAAMAETRTVRADLARLCQEFGPSPRGWTGWSARISLTTLNQFRRAAGVGPLTRTPSNDREDTTMRYRRERDEAREQAEQMELERNDARELLARHKRAAAATHEELADQRDRARGMVDGALAVNAQVKAERDDARDMLRRQQTLDAAAYRAEVDKLTAQRDEAREVANKALAANEQWAATLGDIQQDARERGRLNAEASALATSHGKLFELLTEILESGAVQASDGEITNWRKRAGLDGQ
jgi:hypothetical protein